MQFEGISSGLVQAMPSADSGRSPAGWLERPCLGSPWELWFGPTEDAPAETLSERRARTDAAKAMCAECPFTAFCVSSELVRPLAHQHGIRGGMTAAERKAEIRRRRAGGPEVAA